MHQDITNPLRPIKDELTSRDADSDLNALLDISIQLDNQLYEKCRSSACPFEIRSWLSGLDGFQVFNSGEPCAIGRDSMLPDQGELAHVRDVLLILWEIRSLQVDLPRVKFFSRGGKTVMRPTFT